MSVAWRVKITEKLKSGDTRILRASAKVASDRTILLWEWLGC